jgi:hypothetical protein
MPRLAPLPLFAAVALAAALGASTAEAQTTDCQPDDVFCAEVRIGPAGGSVRVGPGTPPQPPPPPPPPPPPGPPTVIVTPQAPPPPPPPPPQPPTVIVQPVPQAPPPPVQMAPPPQTVVVPPPRPQIDPRNRFPTPTSGLHLQLSGVFGPEVGMGGGGAAFRFRPIPHLGIDAGLGIYGGRDYNGADRVEVPITVDALFFFNPYSRVQVYALAGVGTSFGHAEPSPFANARDYAHLGGQAGVGVEWRISRHFALNADVRAFLRERVDSNPVPEFIEAGTGRATDTSTGAVGQVGMTFYFAD